MEGGVFWTDTDIYWRRGGVIGGEGVEMVTSVNAAAQVIDITGVPLHLRLWQHVSFTIATSRAQQGHYRGHARIVFCVLYESYFESASRSLEHLGLRVKIMSKNLIYTLKYVNNNMEI